MASIGKPKIPISKKDLKQAVLKKNKSFESKNKALESSLKDKEKELKSLEKEYNSKAKEYRKLLKDIEFHQEEDNKLKGALYSNKKLVSDKLKKVDKAEKEYKNYKKEIENLGLEEKRLLEVISKLEFYKTKCEESKNELGGLQVKKDNALNDIVSAKNKISEIEVKGEERIDYYEARYEALEEQAKKHEDMVYQFEQRLIETQDLYKDEDSKLNDLLAKSKLEEENANNELKAITNLCNNTEDKYIEWERKVLKAKEDADKEENRIKKAKENFAKWKIGVLEEVARLKLKNKVDNIDKAGLSDILNG